MTARVLQGSYQGKRRGRLRCVSTYAHKPIKGSRLPGHGG